MGGRAKLERLAQQAAEAELAECSFQPNAELGPERLSNVQARFLESGYERYQGIKKVDKDEKNKAEKKSTELEIKDKSKGNAGPGSQHGSPRKNTSKSNTPTTPRFKGGSLSEDRGEEAFLARVRAAREKRASDNERHAKLGALNDEWKNRKHTTTPVPFASHTGLRHQQRRQNQEERGLSHLGEADKVFKELHEQLHSLELGGPPGWLS